VPVRRPRSSLAAAAALLAILAVIDPAVASAPARPVLGNWEGVGPHGLPLTFVLGSRHGRIVVSRLAVGFPLNCPDKPTSIVAVGYKSGSYGGPGSPPRVRLPSWKPNDMLVVGHNPDGQPGTTFIELDGRLLSPRWAVLSMGVSPRVPKHCGWPESLITWNVRPRRRLAVAAGTWTGPVTLPGGTGTVTVKVGAAGRIVDVFKVVITCTPDGGGASFSAGPPAEEFISAPGVFEGWGNAHWHGRFGANGVLNGTFVPGDQCGTPGQATFTAQRAGG
jgi:hypothetical protein